MLRNLLRAKNTYRNYTRLLTRNHTARFNKEVEKRALLLGSRPIPLPLILGFMSVVYAASQNTNKNSKARNEKSTIDLALDQSDEYFAMGKFDESLTVIIQFKDFRDEEVLWRLARGLYNMSKAESDNSKKKKLILEAYQFIEEAMTINDKHFAVHKWMAVLVDAKSGFDGTKARLLTLETFKKHLEIAMDLNPKDATSIYMLGHYCYTLADMPWYQRQIASALFAKPPTSTYEEALFYFQKAEEVEPNFYSLNLLLLGKTYMKLQQLEPAKYWLQCASNYPVKTEEDRDVRF